MVSGMEEIKTTVGQNNLLPLLLLPAENIREVLETLYLSRGRIALVANLIEKLPATDRNHPKLPHHDPRRQVGHLDADLSRVPRRRRDAENGQDHVPRTGNISHHPRTGGEMRRRLPALVEKHTIAVHSDNHASELKLPAQLAGGLSATGDILAPDPAGQLRLETVGTDQGDPPVG